MPMYEYKCGVCDERWILLRRIVDRDISPVCHCGKEMSRMISAPVMHVWDAGRSFPHMCDKGELGEMTFPSRDAYESHLKARGIAESSTSAPIKRPHGNKVLVEEKI